MSPRPFTLLLLASGLFAPACSERVHVPAESWAHAVPLQTVPEGLQSLHAADCGKCHVAIYEEWKTATHSKAMVDPQFLFEWKKDGNNFLCRNCHAPLQNQQNTIIEGIYAGDWRRPKSRPNPDFDATLEVEGVTCAVCHVRDGVVIGPYGSQESAPHKVRKRSGDELTHKLCTGCHQARAHLGGSLVCSFGTGEEWAASPYPAQGKDCVSCHMPEVARKNSETGEVRPSNHHTWIGGGLAKFAEEQDAVHARYKTGLDVAIEPLAKAELQRGETAELTVRVQNARSGHALPTGDVERFIIIDMRCVSGETVLAERQERIGQLWEWYPVGRQLSDNRLMPMEVRTYPLACPIPAGGAGEVELRVVATGHRMTEKTAELQNLTGKYPIAQEITRLSQRIPVKAVAREN